MRKNKKVVVLRNGSMADDHARSMTSGHDCQAWLAQEWDESVAHEVIPSAWWKKKLQRLIEVLTNDSQLRDTQTKRNQLWDVRPQFNHTCSFDLN